ncbi:hypothetical protein MKQ68_20290 [Chitinophaga horti]|uniref:Uncharacterized protein n=1 Tax=Chitinophaga horti TaxID=2920382 RepID=A0ABY6J248_9BACT|nr:hypothetical protein [Chitinophaga horti]UYQ92426.1 hypothetical protein MKQ68_20290 [Chitinophaga horti]
MITHFNEYYGSYANKILLVGFGIKKLDTLKEMKARLTADNAKVALGMPPDRIVITCGYNAREEQQHLYIIKNLEKLPASIKGRIFLAFPFGYGGSAEYKASIEQALNAGTIGFKIFDYFLTDEEVCYIRIASDVVINAQKTDALSASLQEHIFCGSILFAGSWLPYDTFLNIGAKFWYFDEDKLAQLLTDCFENYETFKSSAAANAEKIYNLSSWGIRHSQWLNLYKEK